jgi:uncharacterized phosphosugar-binding protein
MLYPDGMKIKNAFEWSKVFYPGFEEEYAGILAEELFYRAGGLMAINPIFAGDLMLNTDPITHTSRMERLVGYGETLMKNVSIGEGDVLIVHSVSGRNPVSIEVAMEGKKKGAKVVALTNLDYSKSVTSRLPSGERLFEVADVVLDNHGDVGDACVKIPGLEQKVAATSTAIGSIILNSIIAETVEQLVKAGMEKPPVFYSANLDGGDELNRKLIEKYRDNIHYNFV